MNETGLFSHRELPTTEHCSIRRLKVPKIQRGIFGGVESAPYSRLSSGRETNVNWSWL